MLFFTDPRRTPDPERSLAALPRGSGIVFRGFGAPDALILGRRLARLARRRGVVFLVGADVALAVALRADGIHLPERALNRPGFNRQLLRRFMLTAAAHGLPAVRRARLSGVDAIVVSPVFPSASPSAGKPLGPMKLAELVRAAGVPVYGLGGVNPVSARRLLLSGAMGIAAVEALSVACDSQPKGARPSVRI
jgi:thiamine-phosphate pyrophosphorylase